MVNDAFEKDLFVDSFAVVCSSPFISDIERQTQNCFNRIAKWTAEKFPILYNQNCRHAFL